MLPRVSTSHSPEYDWPGLTDTGAARVSSFSLAASLPDGHFELGSIPYRLAGTCVATAMRFGSTRLADVADEFPIHTEALHGGE